jgi:hypothetical protein
MDEPRPASERFRRFCECLNRFDVEYVVVGSEAVAFHGAPRYSVDFDALVQPTPANLLRVIAALESFGLAERASAIDPELWARTGATLRVGDAPDQIDILLQLTGVTFDRIAAHAARGDYDGTPTRFIGLEELLVNKRAAGRPKDLADVAALERIKRE